MLENPEFLKHMVETTKAVSTDLEAQEDVQDLCAKCSEYSKEWQPVADRLWAQSHNH